MYKILGILEDFFNLIYPRLCASCERGLVKQEKVICTMCHYEIPRTNFHLDPENPVSILFWGRVQVENATSYYWFNKGSKYRQLIHKLKYQGRKDIGFELGRYLGAELREATGFNQIEVIVPVPLHPKRQKKRGYNQSEWIAKGVAESMEMEINTMALYRAVSNVTQTKKNRSDRWDNVASIFKIRTPETIRGKHILLVDDVITTGSTLEACIGALLEVEGVKVSVATLAFAN